jgi:hypothetical protein
LTNVFICNYQIGLDKTQIKRKRWQSTNIQTSVNKRPKSIEVICLDDDTSSGTNPSSSTQINIMNQKSSIEVVMETNVSINYGTPSIQNYFRTTRKQLPPVQVITLDSSQELADDNLIEVAQSDTKDCVSVLQPRRNVIRRSFSAKNTSIISFVDNPISTTPVCKSISLPKTPTSSLKPKKLIHNIEFKNKNDSIILSPTNSVCRRPPNTSVCLSQSPTCSNESMLSTSSNERNSIIGTEPLKLATKYVQMQKALGLFNSSEWCEKDNKCFMGSLYRVVIENVESDLDTWTFHPEGDYPEDICYQTFFDTYTSASNRGYHSTEEESADLWLGILDFLEDCCSIDECPSIRIVHAILLRGIKENSNENVRQAAFSYVHRLILFQYPPHTLKAREFYKKLFVRNPNSATLDLNNCDPIEMWEFFWNVIEEATQLCDYKSSRKSGQFLMLQIVILILESDFVSYVHCCFHNEKFDSSWPIFTRLFWPDNIGTINNRVRQIVKAYLSLVCRDSSKSAINYRTSNTSFIANLLKKIISMLAQFADIYDRYKEQNNAKRNLVESFVICIEEAENTNSSMLSNAVLWRHLYGLKPDWFSAAVARALSISSLKVLVSDMALIVDIESVYLLLPLRKAIDEMNKIKEYILKEPSISYSLNRTPTNSAIRINQKGNIINSEERNSSIAKLQHSHNKENFIDVYNINSSTIDVTDKSILRQTPEKNSPALSSVLAKKLPLYNPLTSPNKINVNRRNKYGKNGKNIRSKSA